MPFVSYFKRWFQRLSPWVRYHVQLQSYDEQQVYTDASQISGPPTSENSEGAVVLFA